MYLVEAQSQFAPSNRLLALMAGSLIFQTVQMGVLPILFAQMLSQRGATTALVGIVLAISWVTVLILGPFVPAILRRYGDLFAFGVAALLTATSIVVLLATQSMLALVVAALLAGAGLIIRWIAADTLVIAMSADHVRGKMIGWHEALMGLGIALGPLAFVILTLRDVKLLSLVLCCAGLILLVLSVWKHVPKQEAMPEQGPTAKFKGVIIIGLAAAFVAGFVENASVALLPLYYDAYGYTLTTSAIFVSGFGLGGTLLQPPLGALSDKMGVKFVQALCILGIILTCGTAVIITAPAWLVVCLLFVFGGFVGGLNTLAVIEAGTVLKAPQIPAAMTAIALSYTIGSVGGPALSGVLLSLSFKPAMLIGFIVISVILGLWLYSHKPTKT